MAIAQDAPPAFFTGVDANYRLQMEATGSAWSIATGEKVDPYEALARAGADAFRVRLWTGDEGMNGLKQATEMARDAQKAGLRPYLVIFLSDDWSDMVKQPLPAIWRGLDEPAKLAAIEVYAERVARHFADSGVPIDLFEIGNEIDFGIAGVFEEEWPKRVSVDYMGAQVWSKMAPIIVAAQRGVTRARPQAKFILHLAQWANADYCVAFWRAMTAAGARVDFPGLSYFPTSAAKADERPLAHLQKQLATIHAAIGKPVLICEYAYPSQPQFAGQFTEWNKPVDGYALDDTGQAKWIVDFLAMARSSPHVAGAFYWSPEWYASDMWGAFALFDQAGGAKPALNSLSAAPSTRPSTGPATLPAPPPALSMVQPTVVPSPNAGLNVYFGNLHAHTGYSDGTGTPEQAFAYARTVGKLDFMAITEHNHLLGGERATPEQRVALYTGPADTALVPTAARFDAPGEFVAMYGQEFSSMSKGNHVNVFDVADVIDVPNGKFDDLLRWTDKHRDSTGAVPVVQLNHPALGRPGKKIDRNEFGRDDFGDDAKWVANMGRVTCLIEVLNGEPLPGVLRRRSEQIMEDHYKLYLQQGFRVAPVGDQDNHKVDWGTMNETRTGIIAAELTKPALLAAMRARHVYASEDKNLKLVVRVNGHLCGDVIPTPSRPVTIACEINDPDEPDAAYAIDVFAGEVDGTLARTIASFVTRGDTPARAALSFAGVSVEGDRPFVYLRVKQTNAVNDVDRAWTAPVWFEPVR